MQKADTAPRILNTTFHRVNPRIEDQRWKKLGEIEMHAQLTTPSQQSAPQDDD